MCIAGRFVDSCFGEKLSYNCPKSQKTELSEGLDTHLRKVIKPAERVCNRTAYSLPGDLLSSALPVWSWPVGALLAALCCAFSRWMAS